MSADRPVTELLDRMRAGDAAAGEALLPLVYNELRALAGAVFGNPGAHHTLQPTALVHEAWMKMAGHVGRMNDSHHFFAIASRAMRQVLADHARAASTQRRGGSSTLVGLPADIAEGDGGAFEMIAFQEALERLEALNPRHARIVELRLLGALTIEETAEVLGVGTTTVETDWAIARSWLRSQLAEN